MGNKRRVKKEDYPLLNIYNKNGNKVVIINRDGRIFWEGREVKTDDDFRKAMFELMNRLGGIYGMDIS